MECGVEMKSTKLAHFDCSFLARDSEFEERPFVCYPARYACSLCSDPLNAANSNTRAMHNRKGMETYESRLKQ